MQKVYEVQITGKFIYDDAICGTDGPEQWGVEDLLAVITDGKEPDVVFYELETTRKGEPREEPELKAGPDTGSRIKTRAWRYRDLGWHDAKEGYMDKEFIYRGRDYIKQAELLGLGTHDQETAVVWLTEEEIVQVREATYASRIARGLKTGIPRNRLNGLGGK